jgi:RNA recognition motif-containing protein
LKKIFVGNLDFGATEESIRSLFEPYGVIERVSLVTDRDSGEADRAIAGLNGTNLGGRALNVNEARAKEDRGGGGGRERRSPRW